MRLPDTFSTLTTYPEFPTKIAQTATALVGRFPYLVVSDALAETNVHGSHPVI